MGAVWPALDIILVALRLYAKRRTGRYGIDDWLVVVSLVFSLSIRVEHTPAQISPRF